MKKNFYAMLMFFALLFASGTSYSQATLWCGTTPWDGGAGNLYGYDTTGGTYTLSSTLALTSTFSSVQGVVGMALDPVTQQMYVVHRDPSGPLGHRLGIVDLTTGVITDIGNVGSVVDIAFNNGTLYGVGGRSGDATSEFYEIDVTDASKTNLGAFSPPFSTVAIANNYNTDQLWYFENSGTIGTVTVTPFGLSPVGGGNPSRGVTMKDPDTFVHVDASSIYEYTISTSTSTFITGTGAGEFLHACSFDQFPLIALVNGPSTFCSNEPSEVYVNQGGTSYQWLVDGTLIPGATDSTWNPTVSGTYVCVLNGTDTSLSAQIIVLPAPSASFTFTPDPVLLGSDASGTVAFTNTSLPNGTDFWWDFGGFFTSIENPSFSFPVAGSYPITLIVTDSLTGCSDTASGTVTVIDNVGINELSADVSIYPIPAEEIVTVAIANGSGEFNVQFMNLGGQIITEQRLIAGSNSKVEFDLTEYESGLYLIKISNSEEDAYYKIIKQ
jgi:hypothetical protein